MIAVSSDRHRAHHARAELNDGHMVPAFEKPERAELVLAALQNAGMPLQRALDHGRKPIDAVHDAAYVDFLRDAWDDWVSIGRGDRDALPLAWCVRGMRHDRVPVGTDARLSYFSFDAGTPITAGTWDAATGAVDVSLSAADLVLGGATASFGLCRPPGHHAAADYLGGYCFLNNAAITAQYMRDRGAARVAVLDVDYHHGNGTQSIFWDRGDVVVANLHADPSFEYPFFLGYADETGVGDGADATRNTPLPAGTDGPRYLDALSDTIAWISAQRPDALVVSLGVDTAAGDPISQFQLQRDDFRRNGELVASLGIPTIALMEGGYAVEEIGLNVVAFLDGLAG
jgi:acetoin utilization deacetylase AcuC-like enzyme